MSPISECGHLGEWLNVLADLRSKGKIVTLADDPKTRRLGFTDGEGTYLIKVICVIDRTVWWKSDEERDTVLSRFGITLEDLYRKYLTTESNRKDLLLLEASTRV